MRTNTFQRQLKAPSPLDENRGSALIYSLFLLIIFSPIAAGFMLTCVNELNLAKRLSSSTEAFWLAEAGVAQFVEDTTMLDGINQTTVTMGGGNFHIIKDDITDPTKRFLTATGTVNGITRVVQVEFFAANLFDNTISTGDDFRFKFDDNVIDVDGKARLHGVVNDEGTGNSATFEDLETGVPLADASIQLADVDGNGTANEFNDFRVHFQNVIATYPPEEVVYYQTNSNIAIRPNDYPPDTKIIYVEGTTVNDDQVDLQFTGTWSGEMLTIVSTGEINYNHALEYAGSTQLNMISYDDVDFEAPFGSNHKGVLVGIDEDVEFDSPGDSTFTGIIVTGDDLNFEEDNQNINFVYNEDIASGFNLPPGFEGLLNIGSTGNYNSTYGEWREIN